MRYVWVAENDAIMKERAREAWELENFKEGEIMEMVDIYEEKGMERKDAEIVVRTMAKYEVRHSACCCGMFRAEDMMTGLLR